MWHRCAICEWVWVKAPYTICPPNLWSEREELAALRLLRRSGYPLGPHRAKGVAPETYGMGRRKGAGVRPVQLAQGDAKARAGGVRHDQPAGNKAVARVGRVGGGAT